MKTVVWRSTYNFTTWTGTAVSSLIWKDWKMGGASKHWFVKRAGKVKKSCVYCYMLEKMGRDFFLISFSAQTTEMHILAVIMLHH